MQYFKVLFSPSNSAFWLYLRWLWPLPHGSSSLAPFQGTHRRFNELFVGGWGMQWKCVWERERERERVRYLADSSGLGTTLEDLLKGVCEQNNNRESRKTGGERRVCTNKKRTNQVWMHLFLFDVFLSLWDLMCLFVMVTINSHYLL